MALIIIGDLAEVIEEAVLDHQETTVLEDPCFAVLLDHLGEFEGVRITYPLHNNSTINKVICIALTHTKLISQDHANFYKRLNSSFAEGLFLESTVRSFSIKGIYISNSFLAFLGKEYLPFSISSNNLIRSSS